MPHVIEACGGMTAFETSLSNTVHDLFVENGIPEWRVAFDRCLTRAGLCDYAKKQVSISRFFVQSPSVTYHELFNIIYHEVAHAITPGHKHDNVWRDTARRLGGDGNRLCKAFHPPAYTGFCKCTDVCHYRHKVRANQVPRCKICLDTIIFTSMEKPKAAPS